MSEIKSIKNVIIQQLEDFSDEFLQALTNLMPQLTYTPVIPSREDIISIIQSPSTSIWVAKDNIDGIIAMLTLAIYQTPTGIHGWIEDVVVDEKHRNKGIGKALTNAALAYAQLRGAKSVSLTSRPFRKAANKLYQNIGFKIIESNLYRFTFE
jgi:ribosomal protein S18 acetylase RimI-like enzyme